MPFYVSPQTQQELAVDIEDCQESIKALHSFVNQNRIAVNSFLEVRIVKSDNFWLSPNYQRDSCHLTQILYHPSEVTFREYFFDYFDLIGGLQPRPHWGKNFQMNISHLITLYPKFQDFLALKDRMDPSSILTNTFLGNLFK